MKSLYRAMPEALITEAHGEFEAALAPSDGKLIEVWKHGCLPHTSTISMILTLLQGFQNMDP